MEVCVLSRNNNYLFHLDRGRRDQGNDVRTNARNSHSKKYKQLQIDGIYIYVPFQLIYGYIDTDDDNDDAIDTKVEIVFE